MNYGKGSGVMLQQYRYEGLMARFVVWIFVRYRLSSAFEIFLYHFMHRKYCTFRALSEPCCPPLCGWHKDSMMRIEAWLGKLRGSESHGYGSSSSHHCPWYLPAIRWKSAWRACRAFTKHWTWHVQVRRVEEEERSDLTVESAPHNVFLSTYKLQLEPHQSVRVWAWTLASSTLLTLLFT